MTETGTFGRILCNCGEFWTFRRCWDYDLQVSEVKYRHRHNVQRWTTEVWRPK